MPANEDLDRLRALSQAISDRPELSGYGEYLALRGAGLRQQALAALISFLAETTTWTLDQRLGICRLLAGTDHGRWNLPLVIPQPLYAEVFAPTVEQHALAQPTSGEAQ